MKKGFLRRIFSSKSSRKKRGNFRYIKSGGLGVGDIQYKWSGSKWVDNGRWGYKK